MSLKCHFSRQGVGGKQQQLARPYGCDIINSCFNKHWTQLKKKSDSYSHVTFKSLWNIWNQQQIWLLLNIQFPKQVWVCNLSGLRPKQLWVWWEGGKRASLPLDFVSICNNFNNTPIMTKGNSSPENPHGLILWRALAVSFLGWGGFELYVNFSQDKKMLWRPSLWNTICYSFKQEPGILGLPLAFYKKFGLENQNHLFYSEL